MKRNIKKAEAKEYDLIVVGGGISGACLAWDASLRGLTSLLLEKNDFGNATSAATSKLLHGGLRYLKNFELSLVRESLSERRIFEVIAPHLVHPIPFLVPTYGHGMDSRLPLMAALTVYDVLGYDKKDIDDESKRIPNHRFVSKERALEYEPGICEEGLSGAAVYYDCQALTMDRLTLEFILSAHDYGAEVLNYFEAIDFTMRENKIEGVVARDNLTGETYSFRGKTVANVSGPWADLTISKVKGAKEKKNVVRSKGIHLITRPLTNKYALVLRTPSDRHFFIIPWRGCSLIGTTDTKYEGNPDSFAVTEKDIVDFIDEANQSYPCGHLTRDDVLYFYGGMRPLVDTDTDVEVYDASRKYEITDHAREDGIEGMITVIGGKYTTSRRLAKQIVDLVISKLNLKTIECHTDTTPLMGGHISNLARYIDNAQEKNAGSFEPELIHHLILHYGSEYGKLLKLIKEKPFLKQKIASHGDHVMAEIEHAIEHEMAFTLEDILFRRTGVGTIGCPTDDELRTCALYAAKRLAWSDDEMEQHIQRVKNRYVPLKEY